jgi:hypothetical protein
MQEIESVIFRMIGIIGSNQQDLLGKILGRRISDILEVSIIVSEIPGRIQESGSSASRRNLRFVFLNCIPILFAVSIINSIPVRNTQKYSDEIHWELKIYGPYHFTRRNRTDHSTMLSDAEQLRVAAEDRPSFL